MDKDKIIGGILAIGLFTGYIFYNKSYQDKAKELAKTVQTVEVQDEKKFDSYEIDKKNENEENEENDALLKTTFPKDEDIKKSVKIIIENDNLKITCDTIGGKIYDVVLKKELGKDNSPVKLVDGKNGTTGFKFRSNNQTINTNDLVFDIDKENSDSRRVTFICDLGNKEIIKQVYSLDEEGFVVNHRWDFINSNRYFDTNNYNFVWNNVLISQENDRNYCKNRTTLNYLTSDRSFKGFNETSIKKQDKMVPSIKWVAMRQRFFTIGIDSAGNFKNANLTLTPNNDDRFLKDVNINVQIDGVNESSSKNTCGNIRYYFGPNDYYALQKFADNFEKNLYIGYPVVREINKYVLLPFINFFHNHISNIGLLIFVLAIIIKLIILPMSLKSYTSMAEMRLLNPTLTLLKEKYKDDPQTFQIEQMKLYQEMGVKPMGGCLPMLLQMPIVIAMFTLIPNMYFFRQQPFLWVKDMSSYDSICTLPFNIPMYGDHVSLFAILMTISTIIYSTYTNKSSPTTLDNSMKMMNYFFPLSFLLVMNNFPAALNCYYFVANVITILQQMLIMKFVDDDKIKKKLEEKRQSIKNKGNSFNKIIQQMIQQQKEN